MTKLFLTHIHKRIYSGTFTRAHVQTYEHINIYACTIAHKHIHRRTRSLSCTTVCEAELKERVETHLPHERYADDRIKGVCARLMMSFTRHCVYFCLLWNLRRLPPTVHKTALAVYFVYFVYSASTSFHSSIQNEAERLSCFVLFRIFSFLEKCDCLPPCLFLSECVVCIIFILNCVLVEKNDCS